jgi:hypothetical protein
MKQFRTFCAGVLLTIAFTVPVAAGNITTAGATIPNPPKGNITTASLESGLSFRELAAQLLQLIAVHQVALY